MLDEFANANAEAIVAIDDCDVLPLGPAHYGKVSRCVNSYDGIDPNTIGGEAMWLRVCQVVGTQSANDSLHMAEKIYS